MSLRRCRRAVTLIEMMVALVITLIMMGAVATIFAIASGGINNGRAVMDVADRLRAAQQRLQFDLRHVSCQTFPWVRPETANGYFEYQEGIATDSTPLAGDGLYGDIDDIVAFTARSTATLFTDSSGAVSPVAEVLWIAVADAKANATRPATEPLYNLYRIVAPVSLAPQTKNVLGEMSIRANRNKTMGAFRGGNGALTRSAIEAYAAAHPELIVLTNVVAFDVRAWDPKAPVVSASGLPAGPADKGYNAAGTAMGQGAWVDLGYATNATGANKPYFATPMPSPSGAATKPYTWDTAPLAADYRPTTANSTPVENGIDDVTARQSYTMFPYPLRGIQVIVRVYEPDSRQVRQVTVVEQFMPD